MVEKVILGEMRPGQQGDFFVLLVEKTRRTTRDGKPFYSLRFRDQTRSVSVPVWENSPLFEPCEGEWESGQHFKIRGVYSEHERYGSQIDIQNIRPAVPEDAADGYDPDAFVHSTRFNVDELFDQMIADAESIGDEPLRQLVLGLLKRHEEELKSCPAASRNHHAYRGGLIEHTVSVVATGRYLAEKYQAYYPDLEPPLNADLIIAGCLLHDIGKLRELSWGTETAAYTIEGNLIGHILIGRDMIREAAAEIPELNPELLQYLEHIILSHQGTPEWGSPREPMMPEALLVHFADDVDAKMNIFVGILDAADGSTEFTDGSNVLRRKLIKARKV
ncbi:3'-5' exoribonuclease YhaM [Planctomycetes bacterium Pan216]|uniref:3'-5' exoribonuclease YhaM n=1 Tax=Kolteria novifilia TaxID=2527975 RepID=A0A518B7H5_9BACT|nr:3'-5' exoribonuclease YhaM [Planctomycetes bacterium Pan216]